MKMRKRNAINESILAGITHLVSTSVEGLSPENISITDSKGNLLSKTGDTKLSGVVSNQFDLSRKREDYFASQAMSIIEKITGPGKAIVKVSVDLDFKSVDEKQIEYDQDKKVPVSQVITTQSTEMPGVANGDSAGKMTKESEETETTQYALSKVERVVSEHEARIKRLTVAVLVDGNYVEEETEAGTIISKYVPRTEEELNQIAAIVKQAIGLNESAPRNDKFEIQSVKFQHNTPVFVDEDGVEKDDKKAFILSIARSSSLVIAVLAFLLFASRALKRMSSPRQQVAAGGYATYAAPAAINNNSADGIELTRQSKEDDRAAIREGIISNAQDDPRTTSNLVRKWLRESD